MAGAPRQVQQNERASAPPAASPQEGPSAHLLHQSTAQESRPPTSPPNTCHYRSQPPTLSLAPQARKEEEAGESVLVCLERGFQRRDGQGGVGQARRFAVPLHKKTYLAKNNKAPCLHRASIGQGPPRLPWLAKALGFRSGQALATGTAWEGLCFIRHHQRTIKKAGQCQEIRPTTTAPLISRALFPAIFLFKITKTKSEQLARKGKKPPSPRLRRPTSLARREW